MIYRKYGKTEAKISIIGLGGHEFYSDSSVMGFSDSKQSIQAGYLQSGFGRENRMAIVKAALDGGINFFDLTIDPEVEAMGRLLEELSIKKDIFIQTRPQGMVYDYDFENKKMADYDLLKAEVIRLIELLKREQIDILNFAFMKSAIDADSEYLDKIGDNIIKLKKEGLIRFASVDIFSGNDTYIKQIESGYFDSIFINASIREKHICESIIPKVKEQNMALLGRALFMKGLIFEMAREAGYDDKSFIAKLAIKWILNNDAVTSVLVGVANPIQLEDDISSIKNLQISSEEKNVLNKIFATKAYQYEYKTSRKKFYNE